MLYVGVFYFLLSVNEYRSLIKNVYFNLIKICDCFRVEMDVRDFLWGFFFIFIRSDMCV